MATQVTVCCYSCGRRSPHGAVEVLRHLVRVLRHHGAVLPAEEARCAVCCLPGAPRGSRPTFKLPDRVCRRGQPSSVDTGSPLRPVWDPPPVRTVQQEVQRSAGLRRQRLAVLDRWQCRVSGGKPYSRRRPSAVPSRRTVGRRLSCRCGQAQLTPEHLLQDCCLLEQRRLALWPEPCPLSAKLFGTLEDLGLTRALVDDIVRQFPSLQPLVTPLPGTGSGGGSPSCAPAPRLSASCHRP